jgi:hypothetical protein
MLVELAALGPCVFSPAVDGNRPTWRSLGPEAEHWSPVAGLLGKARQKLAGRCLTDKGSDQHARGRASDNRGERRSAGYVVSCPGSYTGN